jgi:hypothetical protein
MRRSKPGSHGSIRLNSSGLAHLEHGGRRLSTKLNLGGFFTVRSASAFPEIGRTEKGRRICSNGPSGFKNDFEMKNAPPRLCVPYNQLGFAVESKNPFHQRNKAAVAEQTHGEKRPSDARRWPSRCSASPGAIFDANHCWEQPKSRVKLDVAAAG